MEKFLRECKAVTKHLDTTISQIDDRLRRDEKMTPEELLRQHRHLQESVYDTPVAIIRKGMKFK